MAAQWLQQQMPYKWWQKGAKKKQLDPFSKKDWYGMKALAMFNIRNIRKTLATRTWGTYILSNDLKGTIFEVSLSDLKNDVVFSKFKLITEDVQDKNCLTSMAWILLVTKCVSRPKNGRPYLKFTSMSRLPMAIWFVYSVLVLQKKKKKIQQSDTEDLLFSAPTGCQIQKMMKVPTQEVQRDFLKEAVNKWIPCSFEKVIKRS